MGPALHGHTGSRRVQENMRLWHQGVVDLRWWAALSTHALLGRVMWPISSDAVLHTDASHSGWAATWNGTVPAKGFHDPALKYLHIKDHELGAVRLALESFVSLLCPAGTEIRLTMESLVSVHVGKNGTSR